MAGARGLSLAFATAACVSAASSRAAGKLALPSVLGDDMVLAAAPRSAVLWGTADPGATVTTTAVGGHRGVYKSAPATPDGSWSVTLPPVPPTLDVTNITLSSSSGGATASISRVLFGDVVVCGGQSNMQFSLNLAFNGSAEIAASGRYAAFLRLLTVARVTSADPQPDARLAQRWAVSGPRAVDDNTSFGVFSAECYLTGRMLVDMRPGVPVGLVSSCWSGSMIQPWMPPPAFAHCPHARAVGNGNPFSDSQMYNAMIHPLINLAPALVLWHQGEENAGNPVEYRCFFTALIEGWRAAFRNPTLPFVFVQLQPCGVPPAQRYAQAAALSLPAVGMATAVDLLDPGPPGAAPCPGFNQTPACGNPNGMCHTRWKEDIATRLAASAARLVFNATQLDAAGPALPPLSPTVTGVSRVVSKDYRTYTVTLPVAGIDPRHTAVAFGGARECAVCCSAPAFAVEYASDAPGEHWQPLGTKPDKHGAPVAYDPAARELTLTVVVEPPWRPAAFRHAWQDAPQCLLFASANESGGGGGIGAVPPMPFAPFNVTVANATAGGPRGGWCG